MHILENAQIKSQRFGKPLEKLQPDVKAQEIEKKNRELENQMIQYRNMHLNKNMPVNRNLPVNKNIPVNKNLNLNKNQVKKSPQMGKPNFANDVTYARLYKDPNLENFTEVEQLDVGEQERRAFELVKSK